MISQYTKTLRVINSKYYSICVNKNGKDINKEFNETCIIQHYALAFLSDRLTEDCMEYPLILKGL